jgi:hypothetical protein
MWLFSDAMRSQREVTAVVEKELRQKRIEAVVALKKSTDAAAEEIKARGQCAPLLSLPSPPVPSPPLPSPPLPSPRPRPFRHKHTSCTGAAPIPAIVDCRCACPHHASAPTVLVIFLDLPPPLLPRRCVLYFALHLPRAPTKPAPVQPRRRSAPVQPRLVSCWRMARTPMRCFEGRTWRSRNSARFGVLARVVACVISCVFACAASVSRLWCV